MQGFVFISFILISLFNARFRFHLISSFWGGGVVINIYINDIISKCDLVFFSHFRMNMTKMWVHAEADCSWLILPPFSGWLQKFRKTDIVSLASPGQDTSYLNCLLQSFLYARTVTKSWCSVGMFFDRYTNFKFINWYPDVTISI